MTKIAFTTLGCKTNHYDADAMAMVCMDAGLEVVSRDDRADVHVINTCTVTSAADAHGCNLIRRVIRNNPNAIVIVCGCSSQTDADRYKNIEGVDHVLGVRAEIELIDILKTYFAPSPHPSHSPARRCFSGGRGEGEGGGGHRWSLQPRARAFLKIQDGCNNRCAYCIVPFARGESRSFSSGDVHNEAVALSESGYREVILTGVHIGQYGRDLNPISSLAELIQMLLTEARGCRIRISSLDPEEIDDEMIDVLADPRVCRHVHLSLQSGSDKILKMMGRKTGTGKYFEMIASLASKIQGIAIGADIITGFPGETDRHFDETMGFIEQAPFAYLHVFPYSKRPGTKASSMKDQVPVPDRKRRAKKLLDISAGRRAQFYGSHVGRRLDAVIVTKRPDKNGYVKGISDNYVPIMLPAGKLKYRELYNVEVISSDKDRVYGNYA